MMASWILALVAAAALAVSAANGQNLAKQVCSSDKGVMDISYNSANVVFGGFLGVRNQLVGGIGCGKPGGVTMQYLEAVRFAINYVNNYNGGQGYIPGITLGVRMYDSCYNPINAMKSLQEVFPQSTTYQQYCSPTPNKAMPGTIGPFYSSIAETFADYAKEIPVTVMGTTTMSASLSDTNKYPTFFRTVPTSTVQMRSFASLMSHLKWENVVVLHSDAAYGYGAYEELVSISQDYGICVTKAVQVPSIGSADTYKTYLQGLSSNNYAGGLILAVDNVARELLKAIQEFPELHGIHWMLLDVSMNNPVSPITLRQMNGAITSQPKSIDIPEFRDYFISLLENPAAVTDNPWYSEWYEETYSCSLTPGSPNRCVLQNRATLLNNFIQNPYVLPTIKSVFAWAEAISILCPVGTGLCPSLLQATSADIQNALHSVDFTFPTNRFDGVLAGEKIRFDAKGDLAEGADFSFYQYNDVGGAFSFKRVGEYQNGVTTETAEIRFYNPLRTNQLVQPPTALCSDLGCTVCILPPKQVDFQYTPGDLVIASLVNAHSQGDSLFACGPLLEKRLVSTVALQWAIDEYKRRNSDKLRGVTLGSLVADVCPTGAVAAGFLKDLFSSASSIKDDMGLTIYSRGNILGFIDDTDNMMAKTITPILSQYGYPEIQVGATASAIASGKMYPHYSRAIPNEEMYLNALVSLLRTKSWNHVQVVTTKNPYYAAMSMKFKTFAASHDVCVVSTSHFEDGASNVLTELLSDSGAFVVVAFGHADNIKELFDEVKTTGNRGNIQVVSGMAEWATDPRYFDAATSDADYTITLGLRRQKDDAFENYLRRLTQAEISLNPSLTSLFEMTNDCSLISASRGMYTRVCTNADNLVPYQGNAPYMIQGLYNMADKLHEILVEVCGTQNYNGVCIEFSKLNNLSDRLSGKLKNSVDISDGEGSTDIVYYVVNNNQYLEFGDYGTSEQHVISMGGVNNNLLNSKFNRGTTCPGVCVECQYLYAFKDIVYRPGDVMIAGSFSTSSSGPEALQPFVCGDIKTKNGPLYTMAMMYALDQVNNNEAPVSAKGVKIGGFSVDHCSTDGRQKLIVSDVYSGFLHHSMNLDQNKILSWIIGGSGATREAATLLEPLGVPMISPDATSEGLLKDYDNFYRTIQGDGTTASAFAKMSKQLGFRYLQIVHSAGSYGRGSKDSLVSVAQSEGICVTQVQEYSDASQAAGIVENLMKSETHVVVIIMGTSSTTAMLQAITNNNAARQSLVVMLPEPFKTPVELYGNRLTYPPISLSLRTSTLSDFKAYLDSSPEDNPVFANYYMTLHQCNLKGYYWYSTRCSYPLSPITSNPQFVDSIYDLPTINAVYASVDALDRTIKEYCGPDYTEPCDAYLQAPDQHQRFAKNIQFVSFIDEGLNTFRFLQREGNVVFDVMQYNFANGLVEVGSYAGVSLDLGPNFVNSYQNVESACTQPCLECINRGLNFSLTPGDIYLGGLFDVHQSSFSPFLCGRINTLHGFLLQEAFHYALSEVNSNDGQFKDILNGVKLGGIGLDACGSQVRGGQLVSNINNGLTTLVKDTVTVDPSQIDIYIGSHDSSSTRYLARILNDLEVPQISYAAGSSVLSDKRRYPYFFRTVPSNAHQARAILAYLNQKDIRYIQILYEGNTYGTSGRDELEKMAAEYKICIAQAVEYPDLGIASLELSKSAVGELMEKPSANTVVTFLETSYINSVLRAVGLSDRARGKLRFVGSDVWADNKEAIDGADTYAVDSVTLKLDADDVVSFENYINSKTLSNSAGNPWFEEYYQQIHNCYTTPGNPYGYSSPCSQTLTSIIDSLRYQQDPNVITVMNAVYASAFALHKTLSDICGNDYQSVCQAYRNSQHRRDIIADKLDDVEFVDPSGRDFKFTEREVLLDFRLNAIQSGELQGINYRQIGTYHTMDMNLDLPVDYTPFRPWHSGCDREDACSECPAIRDSTVRYAWYQSPSVPYHDAPTIVAFFDIHEQGVDPYRCGKLNMGGFQQFLSFFYGVQDLFASKIRGEQDMGAHNGIRVLAVDTCSNPVRVDQDLFGLLQGTGLCNTNFELPPGVSISAGNIGSVIVSGDSNTMAAARVLEQVGVTYLSPDSHSPLLDSKTHLGRTNTPISGEMRFLAQLADKMHWAYMDVIYEETPMGYYPFHSLQQFAMDAHICLGQTFAIGDGASDQDMERYIGDLNGRRGSKVVVLLGSKDFFSRVLSAAGNLDVAEDYIWILGGYEPVDEDDIEHISPKDAHVQIITFHSIASSVPGFRDFVKDTTLTPGSPDMNNRAIPKEWFEEFYQTTNDCTMSSASHVLNVGKEECSSTSVGMDHEGDKDHYTLNTVLATYAAAEGLHQSIMADKSLATGKKLGDHRASIMEKIMAAHMELNSINVDSEDSFEFNEHRWWDGSFMVRYWDVNDQDAEVWPMTLMDLPTMENVESLREILNISSMCLETERQGYCGCDYRSMSTAALVDAPAYVPSSHRNYYKYDDDGDRVYDWPVWAVAVAILTGIGLFVTVVLFLVLLCAYPRKGGTSILGYLMIIGIMGIYGINFAFFLSATDTVCGIRRFLMGVVYTICFAPLLLKAVDNWRFGHVDYAERKYSGISSACALLLCAIGVILIQCIIPIMWLILEHPEAHTWFYGAAARGGHGGAMRNDNDWCSPADDYDLGLVLSFSFVVLVVFMTAAFSAMSYETKSNNYESRWILFASAATAGCFLVWMIVTTNAKGIYRDPTVAIANFVNATVLMLTVPMRKTYLLIQAKRSRDYSDDENENENDKNPYDMYSESYVNPGYELSDYDQVYMEKPSEF